MRCAVTFYCLPGLRRRNPGKKSSLLLVRGSDHGGGGGDRFVRTESLQ
jgi:hypothetical protein